MARAAKTTKSTKPVIARRKPGRPSGATAKTSAKSNGPVTSSKRAALLVEPTLRRKPGRPAKTASTVVFPKTIRAVKAPARASSTQPTPKVSKGELRAQVEKLEQLVVALRGKSREANKAMKAATIRVYELETEVTRLEEKAVSAPVQQPQSAKPVRAKRQSRGLDPGDAVPPGVSVQEAGRLDEEAETALENLEEHLSHD